MVLQAPDPEAFLAFIHEEEFENDDWAIQALQQATDLMMIASGLRDEPDDEVAQRLIANGIMALAQYLLIADEDREAQYSPFNGERIGSYSYSKATQRVADGVATGVAWFDTAVRYLLSLVDPNDALSGEVWHTKEDVFAQGYAAQQEIERFGTLPDVFGR